jgi:hypothetical protein
MPTLEPNTQGEVLFTSRNAGTFGSVTTLSVKGPADGGLAFVNVYFQGASGSENLTVAWVNNAPTLLFVLNPGQGQSFSTADIASITIGAAAASVYWWYSSHPAFQGSGSVATIATGGIIKLAAGSALVGSVVTTDGAGNSTHVNVTNGGTCPVTGVATGVVAATTGDAISLSDGTNTLVIVTAAVNTGQWVTVTFPVLAGTAYTFSGTGLKLLGASYVVT